MLTLVVHNAKGNFGDPEFRADALQNISQTADKMKKMMDRLAVLSRPLELARARTDLNDIARDALVRAERGPRVEGGGGVRDRSRPWRSTRSRWGRW